MTAGHYSRAITRRATLVAGVGSFAVLGLPRRALAKLPSAAEFSVVRDDSTIGRGTMTFAREGFDLRVNLAMAAKVDFGFITMFRYRHESMELWRDGRLIEAEAFTDDDGEERRVHGAASTEGFVVDGPAGRLVAPADVLPSSYWHPDTMHQNHLLDLSKGKLRQITVSALADETLTVAGQPVVARPYELSGEMKARLWYDDSATWLKTTLKKKGSDVHLVLESTPVFAADELAPALIGRIAEGTLPRQFATAATD